MARLGSALIAAASFACRPHSKNVAIAFLTFACLMAAPLAAAQDVFYWYGNCCYAAGAAYSRTGGGAWTVTPGDFNFVTYVNSVVDQSYKPGLVAHERLEGDNQLAQTFVVGVPGVLTGIDLAIGRATDPLAVGNVVIAILPTVGGEPVSSLGEALTTVVVPATHWPLENPQYSEAFRHVEFPSPVAVAVGTTLAIAVRLGPPSPPIEVPCVYTFGGSSIAYCVSATGTMVKLQAPTFQEHINVGQTWEGYVLCTGTTVQAWDLSATADGFGAPTVIVGPTSSGVTLRRTSAQYQLDQVFKLDKTEKDVTVTMTLTNISGAMIPDVRVTRAYDPDPNNDFGDDLEVRSARGVWAGDVGAVTLTGITWTVPTDTSVDANPSPACSLVVGSPPVVTGDARLASVTYRLGNMAAGAKKKVVFVYRVQ